MAIRRFSSSDSTKIWEHLNRLAEDAEAEFGTRETQTWGGGNVVLVRQGRIRELFVSANYNIIQGNTSLYSAIVPVGDRPTLGNARGPAYFSSGYVGQAWVTPGGEVGVTQRTGGAQTAVQAHIVWTV